MIVGDDVVDSSGTNGTDDLESTDDDAVVNANNIDVGPGYNMGARGTIDDDMGAIGTVSDDGEEHPVHKL